MDLCRVVLFFFFLRERQLYHDFICEFAVNRPKQMSTGGARGKPRPWFGNEQMHTKLRLP